MITIYNLLILCLRIGIRIAALFNSKAKAFVSGRKEVYGKLRAFHKRDDGITVWIHCASLGEFEQGRPVIEALKKELTSVRIVVTFFSPSGYEIRKNYDKADLICYLPWDTHENARKFVELVRPSLAIFVKYEFWYHYLSTLKTNNIPAISISAIFREGQLFFKPYGGFYRDMLNLLSHIFVQNGSSMKMLKSVNILHVSVAGDTRFDRVSQIVSHAEAIDVADRFKNGKPTMVVGSCWPEDLSVLSPFINSSELKFIIAPHELTETFLTMIEREVKNKSVRFSKAPDTDLGDFQVLIVDNIGMLSRLYRYGEYAFVGGAYGSGLHNILEAACYGIPIFFGNVKYRKFQEAIDLIARGGGFAVSDTADLQLTYGRISDPVNYSAACETNRQYVRENLGATEKIMNYCRPLLQ